MVELGLEGTALEVLVFVLVYSLLQVSSFFVFEFDKSGSEVLFTQLFLEILESEGNTLCSSL